MVNNLPLNAPVFDVDGLTKLPSSNYFNQVYAGRSAEILRPLGSPQRFRQGSAAGFVVPVDCKAPDVEPGQAVYVQLRAWDSAWGSSYEEARARARGEKYGFSAVVSVLAPLEPISAPLPTAPLSSFSLRSGNALFTTGALTRGERLRHGEFEWILTGLAGSRYLVEKRMPPNYWLPLMVVTNNLGDVTFTDSGNASAAFYRARILD